MQSDDLAIIAVHFNPCGYKSRIRNYHRFRSSMSGKPLLTLELCFGETEPELPFPEVALLRGGDIMWQRGRLINIGISHLLAQGYEKIAWLDADIAFQDELWYQRVSEALEHYAVVQCFSHCRRVFTDRSRDGVSAVYAAANYQRRTSSTGVAWAARADVLREVPLYQHCIVGGDDDAWYLAFMYDKADIQKVVKEQENQHFFKHASPEFMSHYLQWAEHCASLVKQDVGYVEQTIFSYPHGRLRDRYYSTRQGVLHYFDPCNDVTYEPAGPLCWASNKPELHQVVADYFYHRNEDAQSLSFSSPR